MAFPDARTCRVHHGTRRVRPTRRVHYGTRRVHDSETQILNFAGKIQTNKQQFNRNQSRL